MVILKKDVTQVFSPNTVNIHHCMINDYKLVLVSNVDDLNLLPLIVVHLMLIVSELIISNTVALN